MKHSYPSEACQDSFLEPPHYCHEILRATAEGKNLLALCWRLTADAARNYFRQCQSNSILSSQIPPDLEKKRLSIQRIQEANYRLALALAPKSLNTFSSYWIFSIHELKGAAWNYRHWMHYSQAQDSTLLAQEIVQTKEAVTKYCDLSAEASWFAQEAVRYFQHAQQIQQGGLARIFHADGEQEVGKLEGSARAIRISGLGALENELIAYRLKIAAHEALHCAIMHLNLLKAESEGNNILIDHWSAAADLASHAFHCRIQAAQATQHRDEMSAMHWSLAAYGANNACESHKKLLELLPSGKKESIAGWEKTLQIAKNAMEKRHHVASISEEKKREYFERLAFWAEHCYECNLKKMECSLHQREQLSPDWENITHQAQRIAAAWHLATSRVRRLEYQHGKNIFEALSKELEMPWQELSFCLLETLFPDQKCLKICNEEKLVPEMFTCRHSWIYQTAHFLKQADIPCDLSMSPKKVGIMIAFTGAIPPSFGMEPALSPDVFLVDVVADASPHPAAHCYIVQNQVQAEELPNALFMPHWPQEHLISRSYERGAAFENIVFFGKKENLAPELMSVEWAQRLQQELGLRFKIESPSKWNDYSAVDCAIGIRDFLRKPHLHKPATKLYNAWLAGVPFIGGSDSAFASDGYPGKDYLVATSLEELFGHLKRLKNDVHLRSKLVERGFQSGRAFSKEATLQRWKKMIQETLPSLALKRQKEIVKKERRRLLRNYFLYSLQVKIPNFHS